MALPRGRLERIWEEVNERTVVAVCAPRGFGKTTLLVQWRRLWLERGALVAWVTLDAEDDPPRFAKSLLHSMRIASGRAVFDTLASESSSQAGREIDALTALLAEIANLATLTVLVLDDAERLPEATVREALAYLVYNAPPNLRVVIGTRTRLQLPTWDLAAHDEFAMLQTKEMRLELDESIAILGKRFGRRLALDDCVRLHEITEGWPIGLQLAASSIEREDDLHRATESLSARRGDIERYFIEALFDRLPQPVGEFLTRIAILDEITPELCEAITGVSLASAYLDQLASDTPILIVGELRDWIRFHPLARDFLLGRFEKLPASEQAGLHRRAADWLAQRERFHEAGEHALAAGDEARAQGYAKRSLWSLFTQGKLAEARAWLDRLPEDSIAGDVHMSLMAAWIMALSDQPAQALPVAERVLREPETSEAIQFEAALVATCGAAMSDRLGLIPKFLDRWQKPPLELEMPVHTVALANTLAVVALHEGATERVRQLIGEVPVAADNDSMKLPFGLARLLIGMSHLWDGNAYKTEAALLPALNKAEGEAGRRSIIASLHAAPLAAALYEHGQIPAAKAMLANRLDLIERVGVPDAVLVAYRVLACVAIHEGDERRALEVLESLYTLGESKQLPRLKLASLCEQVRIHALRSRTETIRSLLARIDALAEVFAQEDYLPLQPEYRLSVAIARAYGALAAFDPVVADEHLKIADTLAASTRRKRDALTVMVLRAVTARQRGKDKALPLLSEALGLAAIGGIDRLLEDTHPQAAVMQAELQPVQPGPASKTAPVESRSSRAAPSRPATAPSGLLTPKEAEVLGLLNAGLSNKLIAKSMDISDETVKWHLKNLFSKLSAGTRKHAVDRARLLGLVAA
ncbi:MAG TPA: LuxR C-terminal-related transcriptional regulator [Casimicrobiaceae bacterium]|nr:LuxR C-terminal-related transcriptional regulator [Casimicrobiaceae bacterium]